MAKKDVRNEGPLAWDEYLGKRFDVALPSIYAHAHQRAGDACSWYWNSIKSKRRASQAVRLLALALLIVGTVLPLLAGLGHDAETRLLQTQLGVAVLVVAGLLQVSDRVFGWSSGWLRYIITATAMENLTRRFELGWAAYMVDKGPGLGDADTKPLFDLARQFEEDLAKLQSDETEKWATEFNSGVALLNDLVKSQRESGEKAAEAARALVESQLQAAREEASKRRPGPTEPPPSV